MEIKNLNFEELNLIEQQSIEGGFDWIDVIQVMRDYLLKKPGK